METKPTPKQTLAEAPAEAPNDISTQTPVQKLPPQVLAQTSSTNPSNNVCKYCKNPISETEYFCHTCGKKIKEPPFKFSWGKATMSILFSILFPPLGIFPGIRYLKINDKNAKILGVTNIIVTILFTILTGVVFMNFINNINKTYNGIYDSQNAINNPSGSVQDQIKTLQQEGL